MDDTEHTTSGVGMDVIVAKDDAFRSEYEANADEMTELQESLDALAQEITDGGHPDAAAVDEKQGELRGLSYTLDARVATYRDELKEALERETALDTKLKEFNSKHAHITSWCDTVRRMCDVEASRDRHKSMRRTESSAGAPGEPEELAADVEDWPLDVIEAKIDGLFATYSNQVHAYSQTEKDAASGLAQALTDGGHQAAPEVAEKLAEIEEALADVDGVAASYQERLRLAAQKQAALMAQIKEFRVKKTRVASWISSLESMMEGNADAMAEGCGLSAVDVLVDAFGAKFVARFAEQTKVMAQLKDLDAAVTEGNHASAADVSEELADWQLDVPSRETPLTILCCPEDRWCRHEGCSSGRTMCSRSRSCLHVPWQTT